MHELVIRGGTVIDGTGAEARTADVAVDGGHIAAVGRVGAGRRTIEADGLLVTPGFVDVHTHYDAQAMWDRLLSSSCYHGVTTAVIGNCGVGFAPVRREHRDWVIKLMEGVEDIPGNVLEAGLPWTWESYPEYLDALDAQARVIDLAALVPHAPLRVFAMGERGLDPDASPDPDELEAMAQLVHEAIASGAVGVASLRTQIHRTSDGDLMPIYRAGDAELAAIADGMVRAGRGFFEVAADYATDGLAAEWQRFHAMARCRPLTTPITQSHTDPDDWRDLLYRVEGANAAGLPVIGQIAIRPIGRVLGFDSTSQFFADCPSYRPIADLPLRERLVRLGDPHLKRKIVFEAATIPQRWDMDKVFPIDDQFTYEPSSDRSIGARARACGEQPYEFAYDVMRANGGQSFIFCPSRNFAGGTAEAVRAMLLSPYTVPGLGDGGAHATYICDMSCPTTLLAHWGRDRTAGERLPLPLLVKKHTSDSAALVGLGDRGVIAVGKRADLNVIDFDRLQVERPYMAYDFPAGGRRLMQRARGYRFTIVAGEVTFIDGDHTGAYPGRVCRG